MTLALVLKYWKAGVVALAVVIALAAWHERDLALVARGKALEQARVADSTLRVVHPIRVQVETRVVHDTVHVTRTLARLDTLRDSVLTHIHDTAYVVRYITAADSAAKACSELSHDCQAFRVYATQEIAAWKAKAEAQPNAITVSCAESNAIWGLIGAGAGYVLRSRTR